MKILKIISISLFAFILCACGNKTEGGNNGGSNNPLGLNTMVCTKTEVDEGYTTEETIEFKYTKNEMKTIVSNVVSETEPDYIDLAISSASLITEELNKLSGISYEITKGNNNTINYVVSIDYDKVNIEEMKKAFGEYTENNDVYTDFDKNTSITSVKEEMIDDGYKCN